MGSLYEKDGWLYAQWKDSTGQRRQKATGYQVGQERQALRVLDRLEAAAAAGRELGCEHITVEAYSRAWLDERQKLNIADVSNDEARLRLHILPHIGNLELAKVRARHLVDMVKGWRLAGKLAPKTIYNCYSVCKALFRDAQIADIIEASPCVLTPHHLGPNIDADPEWRATAKYSRAELELLISDSRIPADRQVLYALEALGCLRHGEAAGLRWRHYEAELEPLGRLIVATSYNKGRTKTKQTRYMPVHPSLAAMLAEWKLAGWVEMMGRAPGPDDLVVPLPPEGHEPKRRRRPNPRAGGMRYKSDSYKRLAKDLEALGLRHRRGHDLRRTGISLAQDDGAVREVLRLATHGRSRRDAIDEYTSLEWKTLCTEVAKLQVTRRMRGRVVELRSVE